MMGIMNKTTLASLALLLGLSAVGEAAHASPDTDSAVVTTLSNSDWTARSNALNALSATVETAAESGRSAPDSVSVVLIAQLKTESTIMATGQGPASDEGYSEYYASLIGAVADLKDPRAAAILSSPAVVATGNMSINGLVVLGHPGAIAVLSAYRTNASEPVRTALALAASGLLKHKAELWENDVVKLKALLLKAATDKSPFVRQSAIEGLVASGESDARQVVLSLSSTDSYKVHLDGKDIYPVRDKARLSLEASKN
jgi:HEAT repeat protein